MYHVIQYYDDNYKWDFYFNKKENAENFFREIVREVIPLWEEQKVTPDNLGYNNWDKYVEAQLKRGQLEDVAIIEELITED